MTYEPTKHHRRSIRLRGYDYRQAGAYFVTLVCKNRELLFEDDRFRAAVEDAWRWLAEQYEFVSLDEYMVMPNHLHGIIEIHGACRGGSRTAPTLSASDGKPLGRLVGAFKTVSTKRINGIRGTPRLPVWQRNYYEHVIRNDDELDHLRQYIIDNPANWAEDRENPDNVGAVREPPLRDWP
jgi:REP element-mobilizing transposase RayT